MFGSTVTATKNALSSSLRLGLVAAVLVLLLPTIPGQGASAAEAPPAKTAAGNNSEPPGKIDLNAIKEQLRRLGEAIRRAMDEVARSVDPKPGSAPPRDGGLGELAPKVRLGELRHVYGPNGPTVRSVEALMQYRLVLLGNRRLMAGRVYERDGRIIAEVVTTKERALVARYMIDKTTGVWVPER